MINISEVLETNKMILEENLDVRTITMGISLLWKRIWRPMSRPSSASPAATSSVDLRHFAQSTIIIMLK